MVNQEPNAKLKSSETLNHLKSDGLGEDENLGNGAF